MHLLYNHALIRLNRYRHAADQLSSQTKEDHLRRCYQHASSILEISRSLDRLLKVQPKSLRVPPQVVAVALTEAVDVMTAQGLMARLSNVVESTRLAKTVIDGMDGVWAGAHGQRSLIDNRLQKLVQIRDSGTQPASPVEGYRIVMASKDGLSDKDPLWQLADPIEKLYPKEMDIVYNPNLDGRRAYMTS